MTLKEQACACTLAQQLFTAWRSAFGTTQDDWWSLSPNDKRRYIEKAQNLLDEMRPPRRLPASIHEMAERRIALVQRQEHQS